MVATDNDLLGSLLVAFSFLRNHLSNQGEESLGNYVALGCTDEEVEGVWKWIAGPEAEQEIPYFNFNSGEPNNGTFLYKYQNHAYMYANGTWDDGVDYVAYPFICEWEGDVPLQSDVKIITNTGVKTLPKDFPFPITKTSGDYDKDTLSDWEEVDHNILGNVGSKIYKSDLPLYLDYALQKRSINENTVERFTRDDYISSQLLKVKFLPIVSDPTSKDGDGDSIYDSEDKEPLFKNKNAYNRYGAASHGKIFGESYTRYKHYRVFSEESTSTGDYVVAVLSVGRYASDCANFISQCLVEGGNLEMTDEWYYYTNQQLIYKQKMKFGNLSQVYGFVISGAWMRAKDQYEYFSDKNNFYSNKVYENICLENKADIKKFLNENEVDIGDLMYIDIDGDGDGVINHATIIVGIDEDEIYFAVHTYNYSNQELSAVLHRVGNIWIIKMRD